MVRAACARIPDQRYQSMQDAKNALEQIYFAGRSGILQPRHGCVAAAGAAARAPSLRSPFCRF